MPKPRIKDTDKRWKPRFPEMWMKVPTDEKGNPNAGQQNPFDPEDPAGDWGAYLDEEGTFIVDYCDEEARIAWTELYPPDPATADRHIIIEGQECDSGQRVEDIQVEITERQMWFREYKCALVVQTSMGWRITRQKWICDDSGLPVGPGNKGVWRKDGAETVDTWHRSRKTEFRCC